MIESELLSSKFQPDESQLTYMKPRNQLGLLLLVAEFNLYPQVAITVDPNTKDKKIPTKYLQWHEYQV